MQELTAYQDRAYAERYRAVIDRVAAAEAARTPGRTQLTEAVARSLYKLMAYKDEYEVARLHADGRFRARIAALFEGDVSLEFHLAPPLLAKRDPATGHLLKQRFGPWMMTAFGLLARLKFLRGTRWDPFGRSEERRTERRLIADYIAMIDEISQGLDRGNCATALALALIPERIRGYGHVKAANLHEAKREEAALLAAWRAPKPAAFAAE
jgi:indolepyruvate ferredoxin oxidoreductase